MPERGTLVVDVDGTLCPIKGEGERYEDLVPHGAMLRRLKAWHAEGWRIVLYTSRNMRSFDGNIGLINKHTAPTLLDWLARWQVPFDEIHFAKPWAGHEGFYVDDRAVRPDELLANSAEQLTAIVEAGRARLRSAGDDGA